MKPLLIRSLLFLAITTSFSALLALPYLAIAEQPTVMAAAPGAASEASLDIR